MEWNYLYILKLQLILVKRAPGNLVPAVLHGIDLFKSSKLPLVTCHLPKWFVIKMHSFKTLPQQLFIRLNLIKWYAVYTPFALVITFPAYTPIPKAGTPPATNGAMTSQITGFMIVYSTVCWGAYRRKHQSSASLAFLRGIQRWPVTPPPPPPPPPHKVPVTRKMFPYDDVIM